MVPLFNSDNESFFSNGGAATIDESLYFGSAYIEKNPAHESSNQNQTDGFYESLCFGSVNTEKNTPHESSNQNQTDGFYESLCFGSVNTEKNTPHESSNQNQTEKNLFEKVQNLPPLNLKLRISPSLMHQLGSILSPQDKNNNSTQQLDQNSHDMEDFVSQQITEKKKASNMFASVLRIGTWERVCIYEGDLVAKCYYAKKKLVWEFLQRSLKRKIEIQWADILAIRGIIQENEPGILEVELHRPPSFYYEINPQPRKHTNWKPVPDFTRGQARSWRRHYLQFPPGVLDKHFEKLLQCDDRLFELSQKPFPSLESPYFQSSFYGIPDFSLNFISERHQIYRNLHYPEQYFPAQQVQAYQPIQQSFSFKDSASPNSAENLSMAFWGQEADNFVAAESIARNQVQGQYANASTTPPFVSYQNNNYIESGNMQHSPDAHQMLIEIKQILMSDSEIEYPDDDKSSLAGIASFGALINQSMEGNLGINNVENYVHDRCTSLDMHFSANEHSADTSPGQLYPQPVSWTPHQVTDDIPLPVTWIPPQVTEEIFQFGNSSSFYPMRDDFSTVNNNNGVNRWP